MKPPRPKPIKRDEVVPVFVDGQPVDLDALLDVRIVFDRPAKPEPPCTGS